MMPVVSDDLSSGNFNLATFSWRAQSPPKGAVDKHLLETYIYSIATQYNKRMNIEGV